MTGVLVSYMTQLTYDSIDRVSSVTYPDNDRVTHEYNARGLMARILGEPIGTIVSQVDYTASGQTERSKYRHIEGHRCLDFTASV